MRLRSPYQLFLNVSVCCRSRSGRSGRGQTHRKLWEPWGRSRAWRSQGCPEQARRAELLAPGRAGLGRLPLAPSRRTPPTRGYLCPLHGPLHSRLGWPWRSSAGPGTVVMSRGPGAAGRLLLALLVSAGRCSAGMEPSVPGWSRCAGGLLVPGWSRRGVPSAAARGWCSLPTPAACGCWEGVFSLSLGIR